MSRPTFDETCMATARAWARRSICPRLQVGAVIVGDRWSIAAQGYNGPVSGFEHAEPAGSIEACLSCVHAEANALYTAARRGARTEGCSMYTTHLPCLACAQGIVQAGIRAVLYAEGYRRVEGLHLLLRAGVRTELLDDAKGP